MFPLSCVEVPQNVYHLISCARLSDSKGQQQFNLVLTFLLFLNQKLQSYGCLNFDWGIIVFS